LTYLSAAAASLLIVLRMYVFTYTATTISPYQALIEDTSITIWNKNKVITAMTFCLWGINVAIFIQGKSLPLLPMDDIEFITNLVW
jgi:hypothetical protein